MDQILIFTQLQISYFLILSLFLLLKTHLRLHSSHSSHLLVCFDSGFLESLYSFLKFLSDSYIFSRKLNDSTQSILSSYSQFAQFVIQFIKLGVIGYMIIRNLDLVLFTFILDRYKTTILPLFFHIFKNLYQKLEFLLQFIS